MNIYWQGSSHVLKHFCLASHQVYPADGIHPCESLSLPDIMVEEIGVGLEAVFDHGQVHPLNEMATKTNASVKIKTFFINSPYLYYHYFEIDFELFDLQTHFESVK